MHTLRKPADEGFRPYANLVVATYPLTGGVTPAYMAEPFRDDGVVVVHAAPWNDLGSVFPVLRGRVEGTFLEPLPWDVADGDFRRRRLGSLEKAFEAKGLRFKSLHREPRWAARWYAPPSRGPKRGLSVVSSVSAQGTRTPLAAPKRPWRQDYTARNDQQRIHGRGPDDLTNAS